MTSQLTILEASATTIHSSKNNSIILCPEIWNNNVSAICILLSGSKCSCPNPQFSRSIKFHLDTEQFKNSKEKAELVRDFLMDSDTFKDYGKFQLSKSKRGTQQKKNTTRA